MNTFFRTFPLVGILLGATVFLAGSATAEISSSAASANRAAGVAVEVDTSDHPNEDAYSTDRSVLYHLLATPAYVLHGVTRPLGWGVLYVENRYPELFAGDLPPRAGVPLIELGGPAGIMGGLLLYDRQLFGSEQEVRFEGLYGSSNSYRLQGRYQIPRPFGTGTELDVNVHFFSNPEANFFPGGNESLREDELLFFRRQLSLSSAAAYHPRGHPFAAQIEVRYEQMKASLEAEEEAQRFGPGRLVGLQSVRLFTPQLTVGVSNTEGGRRTVSGTEAIARVSYAHDLLSDRYQYGRYVAELRQYLPLPFMPPSRRLALRARLEQVEPLFGGDGVPFYQLPGLGGQTTLRGFEYNRFQDRGTLLASAEYRYPIWSNWDAVVFADAGQVFSGLPDVDVGQFHWSYGGGIHLLDSEGISFRFEVAGSTEGVRTILTVDPSFRRITR